MENTPVNQTIEDINSLNNNINLNVNLNLNINNNNTNVTDNTNVNINTITEIQKRRAISEFTTNENRLYRVLKDRTSNTSYEFQDYCYTHLNRYRLKDVYRKLDATQIIDKKDMLNYSMTKLITFTIQHLKRTIRNINENRLPGTPRLKLGGNREELIKRLQDHYCIDTELPKLKKRFLKFIELVKRKKLEKPQSSWNLYKDVYQNREKCTNDDDPIICEELKDIDDDYFYVIKESKFFYGFDIRTIYGIILKGRNNQNPLTRKNFTNDIYRDCLDKLFLLKQKNKNIILDDDTISTSTQNNLEDIASTLTRRISCILYEFGYNVSDETLYNMRISEMNRAYSIIYNLWTHNMTQDLRERLIGNEEIIIPSINAYQRLNPARGFFLLMDIYHKFITSPADIEDKKLGAIYIIVSLCEISETIASQYPHLRNVLIM